jgi:hypothetical protein
MTRVEIDWASAEVHDRELVVALTGEASASWRRRFAAVLPQLEHGGTRRWGAVAAKKRRIVVADVEEGGEADVRLLLESLVREANASEPEPPDDDRADDADERIATAFRAFGDGAASSGDGG